MAQRSMDRTCLFIFLMLFVFQQNMCVLENELEGQLGEFRIKMKGEH